MPTGTAVLPYPLRYDVLAPCALTWRVVVLQVLNGPHFALCRVSPFHLLTYSHVIYYLCGVRYVLCVLRVHALSQVYMYSMVHTLSRVPYAGVKAMLQNIFGLDHLGDDTLAIKNALLKVRSCC